MCFFIMGPVKVISSSSYKFWCSSVNIFAAYSKVTMLVHDFFQSTDYLTILMTDLISRVRTSKFMPLSPATFGNAVKYFLC